MAMLDSLRLVLAPPHRAGRPFLAGSAALAGFGLFTTPALVWLGLACALVCLYFFRDPDRVPPLRPGCILAASDGVVTSMALATPPEELGLGLAPRWRVSTFLSVLNVHVNRVPADGVVTAIAYRPGRFLNAADARAGEENERNAIALRLPDGRDLAVVQIAGLIARRIVCELRQGDTVTAGARLGIIRFGSRTDIFLPRGVEPLAAVGQTMIGGETVIAMVGA